LLELDFLARGRTADEAKTNLEEAVKMQFDEMQQSRRKLKSIRPVARTQGKRTVSDPLIEDR